MVFSFIWDGLSFSEIADLLGFSPVFKHTVLNVSGKKPFVNERGSKENG